MYYSEHLMTLTKQEKNPVNKMYLSELNMKWKIFQELAEDPEAENEQLVNALTQYLGVMHNRKFAFNKIRGTGFHHNSPVFSSYYIHDLISALVKKQKIISLPGMEWGFKPFNYNFKLTGRYPELNAVTPGVRYLTSPPVLSLSQSIDFQYRITGKRNFEKKQLRIPYLLFFAFKNPRAEHYFMVEHYTRIALNISSLVKTFVVCESVSDFQSHISAELPVTLYGIHDRIKSKSVISLEVTNKLEENIKKAINPIFDERAFNEKQNPKPREKKPKSKTLNKRRTYKK